MPRKAEDVEPRRLGHITIATRFTTGLSAPRRHWGRSTFVVVFLAVVVERVLSSSLPWCSAPLRIGS